MSTITLMAPTTAEMQRLLTDYEIHLTGAESPSASSITPANASEVQPTRIDSPQTWISNHRRIPDYRPVNRELDWNERTLGSNPFEFVFLNLMFTGVSLNASVAKIWGSTGGKVFTRLFRYAIGGEW